MSINNCNSYFRLRVTVDQFQERQEMLEKIKVYQVKKLWCEVTMGKEKLDGYKSQRDKAKTECNTVKKTYELLKRTQEEIVQKNTELREKTLEQVSLFPKSIINFLILIFILNQSALINRHMDTKRELRSQIEQVKHKIHKSKCELEVGLYFHRASSI